MIPVLKPDIFTMPDVPGGNGLGELGDAIDCIVRSQINAPGELTMVYPITGSLYADLQDRCVIMAQPGRNCDPQPYRIYRITKPMSGRITVYARHWVHEALSGVPVAPFTANDIQGAMAGLKANAMVDFPFTLTTTRTTAGKFTVPVPTDTWSLLGGQQGSVLDVYGGEYVFDGATVRLENRIGQDNGVKVRYGVNMVDLEQDANVANCYTGVVAYWQGEDEEVHSPVLHASGTYNYVRILPVDMSGRFEEKPTVAQLTAAGQAYITTNQIGIPKVSWQVEMVDLADTDEYKDLAILEGVNLGDTVGVEYEALGVDASARCCTTEWDVLHDRYKSLTLGSVKSNIAGTIAGQARELTKTVTRTEAKILSEQISTFLTKAILGANGGSIRLLDTDDDGEPDTLYVADNKDPALAVRVWRWNYLGWAASSNGYNGPFTLGATLEDGLLANFVTAAHLVAGTIQSADGTTFYLNLDTGELRIGGYAKTSDASSQEQFIYISKASGTTSVSANTTWVTNAQGAQNTWTIKRPRYNANYPVLFVAKQRKTVDGTVTCTTPLVDETTTVIDGGHITTGAIDAGRITTGTMSANRISGGTINANNITVSNLNASNITAGTLATGRLSTAAQNNLSYGAGYGKAITDGTPESELPSTFAAKVLKNTSYYMLFYGHTLSLKYVTINGTGYYLLGYEP